MKNNLFWQILESEKKYRIFAMIGNMYFKVSYSNKFLILIYNIKNYLNKLRNYFFDNNLDIKKNRKELNYYYLKGGSPEMIAKTKKMLKKVKLDFLFKCKVKNIKISLKSNLVSLQTNNGTINAKKLLISHGAKLKKILINSSIHKINQIIQRRPAVHLFIQDTSETNIHEALFMFDNVIKYVHDVSRFTDERKLIKGKKKVFVFALKHEVRETPNLKNVLFDKLKSAGIIGSNSTLLSYKWTNYYLPSLSNNELNNINKKSNGIVKIVKSENFCKAIAEYSNKWEKSIKYLNKL